VDDSHDLSRFVRAQEGDYSATSKRYSIKGVEEATAYLAHPVLGPRLLKCAEAVVGVNGRSAREIFGSPA